MLPIKRFIIVDDDPLNNKICKILISKTIQDVEPLSFELAEIALEQIKNESKKNINDCRTVLFLDLNMYPISGWDFLEKYTENNLDIQTNIDIYILTSSVDQRDTERAENNTLIKGYITKPLKKNFLLELMK